MSELTEYEMFQQTCAGAGFTETPIMKDQFKELRKQELSLGEIYEIACDVASGIPITGLDNDKSRIRCIKCEGQQHDAAMNCLDCDGHMVGPIGRALLEVVSQNQENSHV